VLLLEGFGPEILDAVRHHHERMDGRGYPDAIPAGELPTVSRLVAVADAYDAMTSDRPYRLARSPGEACRELRSGLQVDPDLVEELIDLERPELGAEGSGSNSRQLVDLVGSPPLHESTGPLPWRSPLRRS
jgi:HD-GYP domain-containing protein (c-di-GMP phosphodiesterase class II)